VEQNFLKMKRCLLSALAVGLCLAANVMAQVPSYVPTNGLVGYWPFNGNANDESGNGNNGTVNGATLTTDRFGNANKAYSFNGVNNSISSTNNNIPNQTISVSVWVFQFSSFGDIEFICLGNQNSTKWGTIASNNNLYFNNGRGCSGNGGNILNTTQILIGEWIHFVYVSSGVGGISQIYKNGILVGQNTNSISVGSCSTQNLYFGVDIFSSPEYINGKLDDIGIWNRALTQQEITALYNICTGNEITSQPTNAVNSIGSNAQFSVNAVAGSTYLWQSNPSNFGWQNVP
jgi:hypothetical protein